MAHAEKNSSQLPQTVFWKILILHRKR